MALSDYFAGYAAETFVEEKRKDLAIEAMKDKWYRGWKDNAILALNFVKAQKAKDIYETPVGERIKIESGKYQSELMRKSLEEVINELPVNVDGDIKNKVIAKYGKANYADTQSKVNQYTLDRKQIELDYQKTISKIKPDENEDKIQEMVRNAQKDMSKKLESLDKKYDGTNLSNISDAFRAVQDLYLKTYETNLVLKKTYLSDEEENKKMEKIALAA